MKEVKQSRNGRSKNSKPPMKLKGGFITFHPTVAEKIQLKEMPPPLERCLAVIADRINQGCGLTVTQKVDTGSFAVLIYDKAEPFGERITLSAWHTELDRALVGLAFALEARWPDFPSEKPALSFNEPLDDW